MAAGISSDLGSSSTSSSGSSSKIHPAWPPQPLSAAARNVAASVVPDVRLSLLSAAIDGAAQADKLAGSSSSNSSIGSGICTPEELFALSHKLHCSLAVSGAGAEAKAMLAGVAAPADPLLEPAALRRLRRQVTPTAQRTSELVLEYLETRAINDAERVGLAEQLASLELEQVGQSAQLSCGNALKVHICVSIVSGCKSLQTPPAGSNDVQAGVLQAPVLLIGPKTCLYSVYMTQVALLPLLLQAANDIQAAVLQAPVPLDALTGPETWRAWEATALGRNLLQCDCCKADLAPGEMVGTTCIT
jgi:hypothetical protein